MIEHLFPTGVAHYLAGGIMIGLGVSLAFVMTGLVTGMSTFFTSTWSYFSRLPYFQAQRFVDTRQWRLVLAIGLVLGAALWMLTLGGSQLQHTGVAWWQLAIGGFIAGFGARMSNGCTSGHGICGLAFLQVPSLLAVLVFLTTAIVTAHLVRSLGGV